MCFRFFVARERLAVPCGMNERGAWKTHPGGASILPIFTDVVLRRILQKEGLSARGHLLRNSVCCSAGSGYSFWHMSTRSEAPKELVERRGNSIYFPSPGRIRRRRAEASTEGGVSDEAMASLFEAKCRVCTAARVCALHSRPPKTQDLHISKPSVAQRKRWPLASRFCVLAQLRTAGSSS